MCFNPEDFGKRVKATRIKAGMTQQELGERISTDRFYISRLERGSRACSIDILIELATALNVSTDYLLLGKPDTTMARQDLVATIEQLTKIAEKL